MAGFGLKECRVEGYPARTLQNVKDAEATLRIFEHRDSLGERVTMKAIKKFWRPFMDVVVSRAGFELAAAEETRAVAAWMDQFEIVNVAGNSDKTAPGIERFAERFLAEVFAIIVGQQ